MTPEEILELLPGNTAYAMQITSQNKLDVIKHIPVDKIDLIHNILNGSYINDYLVFILIPNIQIIVEIVHQKDFYKYFSINYFSELMKLHQAAPVQITTGTSLSNLD